MADVVTPLAEARGDELVDVEYVKEKKQYYLRIYVDRRPGGIDIEEIANLSELVSEKLDELDDVMNVYHNWEESNSNISHIHINMYSKGFTGGKSLTSDGIIFLLDNLSSKTVMFKEGTLEYIEGHYEADSETYKTALATYKSRLLSEVNLELNKYNY